MKYTKIEKSNYNLHMIKTSKFKTITIKVNLKRKLIKEEITKRNMLINTLFESTNKYPTRRLLEIKTEDLYDLGYRGVNYSSGKYTVLSFEASFINPKFTEEKMYEESFAFLNELIFNPNINEQGFAKNNFDIAYNILKDRLDTLKENPSGYSRMRMLEEMDEDIISYRTSGYMEDLLKLNSKKLYEYYLDVIKNDMVDIFVIGDFDDKQIEKLVQKYLVFKTNKKIEDTHFYYHTRVEDEIKFVNEKVDKEQSTLVLGFKNEKLTEFEKRYVMNVYNYILGGSTDSNLFKTVREQYSLCYYINSSSQPLLGITTISAGINASDYEETISLINRELNNIKNGQFEEFKIENAKTTYINSLSELEDNPDSIISLYTSIEYLKSDTVEKRKEEIIKVTKDDVIALANKIHLNMIFLLEGSDCYEEE